MVISQLAKLWIILALKFSELLLQLFVLYRLVVQQNAKVDIYLNEKVFCSGSSDFLFTELIFEIKAEEECHLTSDKQKYSVKS